MGFLDKARGKLKTKWANLPAERKEELKERVHAGMARWKALSPEKKAEMRERMHRGIERWRALPQEKKEAIKLEAREKFRKFTE